MDQAIDFQALPQVAAGRARGGRETQQDALLCLHDPANDALMLVLADGMGGDGAGELAAEGVIEVARRLWELGLWREQPGALFLEALCQEAHAELVRRREGLVAGEPHSTVVALLLRGKQAYWAH
ncbi:MAG: serine/threonine-protein phosphatase, partial [Xanthomonadaceae bacterium]|nr:serine/threonine-protein phosphatase [Xanthomonadaceae bacterium]